METYITFNIFSENLYILQPLELFKCFEIIKYTIISTDSYTSNASITLGERKFAYEHVGTCVM